MAIPTIPILPDNFHKILLTLGLLGLVFCIYKTDLLYEKHEKLLYEANEQMDETEVKIIEYDSYKENIITKARILSNKYDIQIPIKEDSGVITAYYYHGLTAEQNKIQDSIWTFYSTLTDTLRHLNMQIKRAELKTLRTNRLLDHISSEIDSYQPWMGICAGLVLISLFTLFIRDERQNDINKKKESVGNGKYLNCQSCGLQFNSIIKHGSNADGEKNDSFCEDCFSNGQFTQPNLTAEEMWKRTMSRINSGSGIELWIHKKQIKNRTLKLERWLYKSADDTNNSTPADQDSEAT